MEIRFLASFLDLSGVDIGSMVFLLEKKISFVFAKKIKIETN